jgi:hypothetical protein
MNEPTPEPAPDPELPPWVDPPFPPTEEQYNEVLDRLQEVEDNNDQLRELHPIIKQTLDSLVAGATEIVGAYEETMEWRAVEGTDKAWDRNRLEASQERWNKAMMDMEGIVMGYKVFGDNSGRTLDMKGKTGAEALKDALIEGMPDVITEVAAMVSRHPGLFPRPDDKPGVN